MFWKNTDNFSFSFSPIPFNSSFYSHQNRHATSQLKNTLVISCLTQSKSQRLLKWFTRIFRTILLKPCNRTFLNPPLISFVDNFSKPALLASLLSSSLYILPLRGICTFCSFYLPCLFLDILVFVTSSFSSVFTQMSLY